MRKSHHIIAIAVLAGTAIAFACRYLDMVRPPSAPVPSSMVTRPAQSNESLAETMAQRINEAIVRYHDDHGSFPPAGQFWPAMKTYMPTPLHNPLNDSPDVERMSSDIDASRVGWVYDETDGVIYPGVVFNSPRTAATQPAAQ